MKFCYHCLLLCLIRQFWNFDHNKAFNREITLVDRVPIIHGCKGLQHVYHLYSNDSGINDDRLAQFHFSRVLVSRNRMIMITQSPGEVISRGQAIYSAQNYEIKAN